jgi:hypothetical protein
MKEEFICPEDYVCFSEDEWGLFIREYELDLQAEQSAGTTDAHAVADFTWQVLFLSPWELAYIALPMSVLAFYGLSIYATFKWLQKRFR